MDAFSSAYRDGAEVDGSHIDDDIPTLSWRPEDMRALLQCKQAPEVCGESAPKRVRLRAKSMHTQALSIVDLMCPNSDARLSSPRRDGGPQSSSAAAEHVSARNDQDPEIPKASLYPTFTDVQLTSWFALLQRRSMPPTQQQVALLQAIADRVTVEVKAGHQKCTSDGSFGQPLFDLAHGQPGCGKSRLLAWIRELFEDVFKWKHGVHFVCLAFENTMAAQIAGETIHHWSGIPCCGSAVPRDPDKLSTKCQCLRWILVDGINMVSSYLFGKFEAAVSNAVREDSPFRLDKDGQPRPFSGMNVVLFGDMWQLKPLRGIALCASPSSTRSPAAYSGSMLIWKSLRRCWELCGSHRCTDVWYNRVLDQCRDGELSEDAYLYLHGYPTGTPTSYTTDDILCSCQHRNDGPTCQSNKTVLAKAYKLRGETCGSQTLLLYTPWVERFVSNGITGAELVALECDTCKVLRAARNKVLSVSDSSSSDLQCKPWDTATALYMRNVPLYYPRLQRARAFAQINQEQLYWVIAKDIPLHRDDRDLACGQQDIERRKWLELREQETAHVAGHVPLAVGMPMRLTDTVDHNRQLFRGRRCKVQGWKPHPDEERIDVDGAWILSKMPQVIYLLFDDASWRIHSDLDQGVYPMTPVTRNWQIDKKSTTAIVRRTGFCLIPDFAATAQMVQGQSLDAAFVDVVTTDQSDFAIADAMQVASYVMLSRITDPRQLRILRPFPRELFTRGTPAGPHVLMKKLRGDVTFEQIDSEMARFEEMKKSSQTVTDPMKRLYRCTHCLLASRDPYMKPAAAFGAHCAEEIMQCIDRHGAWTRCLACQEEASKQRADQLPTLTGNTDNIDPAGITCAACQLSRPLNYFSTSAVKNRKRNKSLICTACNSARYCAACSTWLQETQFRVGADTCKGCQLITCASCGDAKAQAQFKMLDRKHYFSDGRRIFCIECRTCSEGGIQAI